MTAARLASSNRAMPSMMLQCWYRTRAMRGRRAFPYRDLRSQSPRTRVASEAHLLARGVPAKFHEVRGTSWNLSRSVPLSFVTVTQVSNLSDTSAAHPTPRCCCPTRSEEAIPRSTETRRISDAHLSLKEISLLFELSLGTRLQHCVRVVNLFEHFVVPPFIRVVFPRQLLIRCRDFVLRGVGSQSS